MTADEWLVTVLKAIQECDIESPRVMMLDSLEWSLSWDDGLWVLVDDEGVYWVRGTEGGNDLATLLQILSGPLR